MEEKKGKLWEKGILIALVLIVLQLILHFTGQDKNTILGLVSILIFLVGIIYVTNLYSKDLNGQVTFGNLFAHGFKIAAIVTLIMLVWAVLMYKVIFPDMQDQIMQLQREESLKRGVSDEQVNQAMAVSKKFFMTFLVAGTVLYYIVLGAIGALLGAALSKRIPAGASPFQDQPGQPIPPSDEQGQLPG